jgi:hypothetical protein
VIRSRAAAPAEASARSADAAIVMEVRGVQLRIDAEADFGLVAMVVAILGAGGAR